MPAHENITVTPMLRAGGVVSHGAPARSAMSASPVASMTRRASTARRPDLLSVMTPVTCPDSTMGCTARQCSSGWTPASATSSSATTLNSSGSSATLCDCDSGWVPPRAAARCSSSMPMPCRSTVSSCRYQAMLSTPTWEMAPPKQP